MVLFYELMAQREQTLDTAFKGLRLGNWIIVSIRAF